MHLELLQKEDIERYTKYDPFGMIGRILLPGYYCVGVFPGSDAEEASGLMLYSKTDDAMTIEWLFVDSNSRGRGMGEALLDGAYRLALSDGIKSIGAALPFYGDRKRICNVEEGYIRDRYFEEEHPLSPEWHGKLGAVAKNPNIKKASASGKTIGTVTMLSQMTSVDRRKLLKEFETSPIKTIRMGLMDNTGAIDPSISLCSLQKDKLTGAVLFESTKDDLYLSGFLARSKPHAATLLAKGLCAAREKYPAAKLHIILRDNIYSAVIAAFLGQPESGKMLYANTEMYLADQAYPEDAPDFMDALLANMMPEEDEE